MSYKKWIIAALLCFAAAPAWAAQAPITLEANYLQYNDETGDMMASGNVKMNQETTYVFTQLLTGNVQTGDLLANGQVTFTEPKGTMTGEQLNYNYKTKEGKMGGSKGKMDGQLITAESTIFHPGNSETFTATVTKCPAKIPDYKMTAEKVVIYPGDKLIAYNAAFWIKNTKIYTMAKYVKKLDEKERESSMPTVGYRSDDGLFIKQHLAYPLNDRLSASAELAYYTKRGFRTQFGLNQDFKGATLSVHTGEMQNADGEWYKRQPEITYTNYGKTIPGTNLNWAFRLQASHIIEEATNQNMWQEEAVLWLNHDPIKLGEKTTLSLGTYYDNFWYDDSTRRGILGFSSAVYHRLNDKMFLGVGYNYAHENRQSPFTYNEIDVNEELTTQLGWQVDRLWYVGVNTSYDLAASRLHTVDYTIKRNLHCFEAEITYRKEKDERRDELRFRLRTIQW